MSAEVVQEVDGSGVLKQIHSETSASTGVYGRPERLRASGALTTHGATEYDRSGKALLSHTVNSIIDNFMQFFDLFTCYLLAMITTIYFPSLQKCSYASTFKN